jgi:tRNA A37 threonylcarbamoyladenosine dehydratase
MPTPHARSEIILGQDGLEYLYNRHVAVVGIGGVGSFAAEAIGRSGIGRITLVDHDVVGPSNLNRQLVALKSTLGRNKAEIMAERIGDIHPEVTVEACRDFITPDTVDEFVTGGGFDYVLDCIDSIACKSALVAACQRHGVPVASALGAGNRLDVTQVHITKLNQTEGCPLAREMRKALKRLGARLNYPVVYSSERPSKALPHQPVGGNIPGRPRAVNGTVSWMPGLFGIMLAGFVVTQLLEGMNNGRRPG